MNAFVNCFELAFLNNTVLQYVWLNIKCSWLNEVEHSIHDGCCDTDTTLWLNIKRSLVMKHSVNLIQIVSVFSFNCSNIIVHENGAMGDFKCGVRGWCWCLRETPDDFYNLTLGGT